MTLALCLEEGEVTNGRLQFALDLHSYDITKMLQDLSKKGFIIQDGKGRGATYHINKGFNEDLLNRQVLIEEVDSDSTLNTNVDRREINVDSGEQATKRMDKLVIDKLIVEFCTGEYKTLDEISEYIDRKKSYIRNTILPRLLKTNKLQRKYSAITNRNQSYIAL